MLMYQLSRITTQKGALLQDDRLDALSIAVNYWVEQMNQDVNERIKDRKHELLEEELEKFKASTFGGSTTSLWKWM